MSAAGLFTVSYMLHGRRVDTAWSCYDDAAMFASLIEEGDVDALLLHDGHEEES